MEPINCLLLVEDDGNDVVLTERKLKLAELPVKSMVVARSLSDALRKLSEPANSIDVVLLDLNLGTESRGLDTLAAIRPLFGGIIIVLTSIPDEQVGVDAVRSGAEDFLVKGKLTEERLRSSIAFAQVRHVMKNAMKRLVNNAQKLSDLMTPGG